MSKHPKNGQVSVTVPQEMQFKIEVNREQFLSIAKKLHKEIKNNEKPTDEIKLSEVQEFLAKAFGNRNWREMDEKFTTNTVQKKSDVLPVEDSYQYFNDFNVFLRALKPTEIAKILTFSSTNDLWGQRSRVLALIVSHILYQLKDRNWDRTEISHIYTLDSLYTLYTSIVDEHKTADVLLFNKNEEDHFIEVELTEELKVNVIRYIQSLPNYESYKFHEDNKEVTVQSSTADTYGYDIVSLNHNLDLLRLIEKDFLMFDLNWKNSGVESDWKKEFFNFYTTIAHYRKKFNWKYPVRNEMTFYFSDLFILFAKTLTNQHQLWVKDFIINILNNKDSFTDIIEYEIQLNSKKS